MLSWDESASDGWGSFEDFRYHKTWPNFFRLATHLMSLPNRPHRFVSSKETFFPPQKLGRVVHSHGMAKHRVWSRWGRATKKNIITRRKSMLCDDIFLMLLKTATEKKSRKLPEKGELFFFRSFVCASTKIMMKERNSFHLQSTPGEFYETLLAPVNAF